jgi:hypothetical protein
MNLLLFSSIFFSTGVTQSDGSDSILFIVVVDGPFIRRFDDGEIMT